MYTWVECVFCCWGECFIDGFSVLLVYRVLFRVSITLLIYWLLKVEYFNLQLFIVELSTFLSFCFRYFEFCYVHIFDCYILLMNWPFCDYSMFFIANNSICFKVYFGINVATPALFWLLFVWYIFLHPSSIILFCLWIV